MFKLHFSKNDSYAFPGEEFYFATVEEAETFARTATADYEAEIYEDYEITLDEYFEEVSPWWIEKITTTTNVIYR